MIIKLIILAIIVWFGLRIYQTLQVKKQGKTPARKAQDMVSCDNCGIHIPANEALKNGDKFFCSREHLPKKD